MFFLSLLTNLDLFVTDENKNYLFPIIRILSQGCSQHTFNFVLQQVDSVAKIISNQILMKSKIFTEE